MFSDITQEIEVGHFRRPSAVINESRRIGLRVEIKQTTELLLHGGDVGGDGLFAEQLSFGGLAAGVADRPGRAAGDGDRMMPEQLKPAEAEQRHEIARVQAVGSRIEAAVEGQRRGDLLVQFLPVGAIRNQPAPIQFFQNVHEPQKLSRLTARFTRGKSGSARCRTRLESTTEPGGWKRPELAGRRPALRWASKPR